MRLCSKRARLSKRLHRVFFMDALEASLDMACRIESVKIKRLSCASR